VRVRYVGPADLTTSKTGLRYASQDRARPTPYAKSSARGTSGSMTDDLPQAPLPSAASAPATASLYRVQAGAFSDRDNARKVAAELGGSRRATIETTERRGEVLYRVMLPGGVDEDEAWALRDRIAELGYADARVIRPF
ncbi:MAG TPA: SPOR domain-containing protein, partial [Phenylobacterium sp.]|nr:SPOR domain-containing protein [Phenylobacterium sp.]